MPKRKRELEDELSQSTTYVPLSHAADSAFRICTILPGETESPASCRLSEDDWETTTAPYEAVSYVWGDHKFTKTIYLNGKPFEVGENLDSILRQLRLGARGRRKSKPRRLWVDAICINQDDLVERGHQVRRMNEIYSASSQSVVWLGNVHSDSELAFDFMSKRLKPSLEAVGYSCTDEASNAAKSGFWDQWDEGKDAETLEAVEHLIDKKYAKSWSAVAKLLRRPWWNRAWTVQELISAKEVSVHCGPSSVPWALMEMTIQLMLRNTEIENLFPRKDKGWFHDAIEDAHAFAYERYHRVLGGHGPESFPQLMQVTRCREALDPRDKVFSILSLLDTTSTEYHYEPDYSEPVHTAYVRAARTHIQSSRNLHVLSSCAHIKDKNASELPSWVPAWDRDFKMSYLGGHSAKDIDFCYKASKDSLAEVDFRTDSTEMHAHGIMIDIIKTDLVRGGDTEFDYLYTSAKKEPWVSWDIHQMAKLLEDEADVVRPVEETVLQAVLTTFVADRNPKTGKRGQTLKLRRIKDHLWPNAEDLEAYLSHVQMFTQGRTLALSKGGYLALAPSSAMSGDKICVLYGCHAPVILRPSPNCDMYTLVGDAYVHGLMDGEALRLAEQYPERRNVFKVG